jgi:glycosyltransferase involved in cell wall biosynthesis
MKIALIAEHAGQPLDYAAATYPADPAARIRSLAEALASLDHQVTVYTRRGGSADGGANIAANPRFTPVNAGPRERLTTEKALPHARAFARGLAGIWAQDPPDVAHGMDWVGGLAALCGTRDLGIDLVHTFKSARACVRRGPARPADQSEQHRLEAEIGRRAAAVLVGHSDDVRTLARHGLPRTAVTIVPDGVDTNRFAPRGPVAERSGRPRLLMFAPLAERQVIAASLRALARVPDAELVIATGLTPEPYETPGCLEAIRLADDLRLRDRLIITGRPKLADAPAVLRSADIVLSPTGAEPFAALALEAMACGVPVIATAAGAQRDAVIHGTTGFLLPPGEPDLLAGRVRQLLASTMLREAYGIAAITRARARYSWERIGQETLAVYQRLSASAGTAAAA